MAGVSGFGNKLNLIAEVGAGTVTSIAAGTGITLTPDPIVGAGTVALTVPVTGANGGTGVANTGKTITLGGDLATSGAFALTLTLTGATGVTLPTSGTLVNSAVTTLSSLTSIGTLTALTVSGLTAITAISETHTAPAITAGTLTIDLSLGTVFNVASNANITTFTISNAPAGKSTAFTLVLTANGSGFTQAWGAAVVWPGGVAPTLTTTNAKRDILTFFTNDGGTTWFGIVTGQNY
jgi:hypothetical protein